MKDTGVSSWTWQTPLNLKFEEEKNGKFEPLFEIQQMKKKKRGSKADTCSTAKRARCSAQTDSTLKGDRHDYEIVLRREPSPELIKQLKSLLGEDVVFLVRPGCTIIRSNRLMRSEARLAVEKLRDLEDDERYQLAQWFLYENGKEVESAQTKWVLWEDTATLQARLDNAQRWEPVSEFLKPRTRKPLTSYALAAYSVLITMLLLANAAGYGYPPFGAPRLGIPPIGYDHPPAAGSPPLGGTVEGTASYDLAVQAYTLAVQAVQTARTATRLVEEAEAVRGWEHNIVNNSAPSVIHTSEALSSENDVLHTRVNVAFDREGDSGLHGQLTRGHLNGSRRPTSSDRSNHHALPRDATALPLYLRSMILDRFERMTLTNVEIILDSSAVALSDELLNTLSNAYVVPANKTSHVSVACPPREQLAPGLYAFHPTLEGTLNPEGSPLGGEPMTVLGHGFPNATICRWYFGDSASIWKVLLSTQISPSHAIEECFNQGPVPTSWRGGPWKANPVPIDTAFELPKHPGAHHLCLLSWNVKGHRQQCCYDRDGQPLNKGPAAATADFADAPVVTSPNLFSWKRHAAVDVKPFTAGIQECPRTLACTFDPFPPTHLAAVVGLQLQVLSHCFFPVWTVVPHRMFEVGATGPTSRVGERPREVRRGASCEIFDAFRQGNETELFNTLRTQLSAKANQTDVDDKVAALNRTFNQLEHGVEVRLAEERRFRQGNETELSNTLRTQLSAKANQTDVDDKVAALNRTFNQLEHGVEVRRASPEKVPQVVQQRPAP